MNTRLYPTLLAVALLGSALPARAASHDTVGAPVSVGTNTYTITVQANNGFMRDEDKLRADASDAAAQFCQAQGKTLKIVAIKSTMPTFSFGYGSAKITFMALNPNDPILSAPAAPAAAPAVAGAPATPPPPQVISTDELYTQLLKLDDLRKKGILTEEEFEQEKKKVLSHTQ